MECPSSPWDDDIFEIDYGALDLAMELEIPEAPRMLRITVSTSGQTRIAPENTDDKQNTGTQNTALSVSP